MKNGVEAKPPTVRPPGPPKVWFVVDGVKKSESNEPVKFTIQEIPEDRYEEVVDHMCTYFLADEPICSSLNAKDDPPFVKDFAFLWRQMLSEGISVGAFVDDPQGGKPIMAGVNVLGVDFRDFEKDYKDLKMSSNCLHVMDIIVKLCKKANVYEKYNVDRYMYALGLSVNPAFRGQALGGHLLRARDDIGRAYQIPVTSTAFTSPISQKLAARCGFEDLLVQDYDNIYGEDGKIAFPNITAKTFKVMGKRLG